MSTSQELQFEYRSGCLIVRATGRYIIMHKEMAFQQIAAATRAQPVRALLADLREVEGPFTFLDRYDLGEQAARHLSHIPLAALAHEYQVDPKRIGQMVARNRGARVEVFTEPAEAETWLANYSSPAPEPSADS